MSVYVKFLLPLWMLCALLSASAWAETSSENPTAGSTQVTYRLGSGDIVKIKVFNQEDLSGEYTVQGTGRISLPLIGDVNAQDKTVKELEEIIANKLKPDYLLNPRVNVQVLNYRPFYILGEVKEPKSYPYVDGMTYRNAVAIAGGFTYRAKENHVIVVRANDDKKTELRLDIDALVQPGDIIHIEERFF